MSILFPTKSNCHFVCVKIEENLNTIEDFLGYFELPDIPSDTIAAVIKDSICFELLLQNLWGQTYDGVSNMMGKNSGVAQHILKE